MPTDQVQDELPLEDYLNDANEALKSHVESNDLTLTPLLEPMAELNVEDSAAVSTMEVNMMNEVTLSVQQVVTQQVDRIHT